MKNLHDQEEYASEFLLTNVQSRKGKERWIFFILGQHPALLQRNERCLTSFVVFLASTSEETSTKEPKHSAGLPKPHKRHTIGMGLANVL
jgi:hypothetical protein